MSTTVSAYGPALVSWLLALLLAPLLPGIIHRVKALFAGRRGQPLLQAYFDLWKLLRKGAVYSRTTTWLFRAGPVVGLAAVMLGVMIVPLRDARSLLHFPGDFLVFAYLLALLRFFTVLAALDTGSSFEGMGASREVQFSALAEPALFLGLAALARKAGALSLDSIYGNIRASAWRDTGPVLVLLACAFLVVFLTENARIPVDDPNTHLELTMIHEVMVLDHGGPDLAFVTYAASLKLWVLGSLVVGLVPGRVVSPWLGMMTSVAGLVLLAVVVGIVESSLARLRLVHVPHLLVGASALSALAAILVLR